MEAILLVLALSLDAFVASLAYGANKIEIPFKCIIIIDLVCAAFLTLSVFGTLVKSYSHKYSNYHKFCNLNLFRRLLSI